jgi:hypothetical protein
VRRAAARLVVPRLRRGRRRLTHRRSGGARAGCSRLLARRQKCHADQDRDQGDYMFLHRVYSTSRHGVSLVV